MSGLHTLSGALAAQKRVTEGTTGNLTASGSNAESGFVSYCKTSVVPTGRGGSNFGGMSVRTQQRITEHGSIVGSASATHIAISGDGFMPVAASGSSSDEILFTRLGTFDVDKSGALVNENGYTLKGWKLDDAGRRPGDRLSSDARSFSDMSSLDSVTVKSLSGKPKATSEVALDMRLNAAADTVKGSGQVYSFSSDDVLNSGISESDLIVPSSTGISIDDKLTIAVGNDGQEETYVYGGVVSSFNIAKTAIAGVTNIGDTFKTAGPSIFGQGHRLRVQVSNNAIVDLKFVSGAARAESLEFNSLSSLKDALNKVEGVIARIAGDTLFIGPKNGSDSVTFSNCDTTDFVTALGLSNIKAANPGENRYASLATLKSMLQANSDLKAVKATSGGIDVSALKPTDSIKFTASSSRSHDIAYISATETDRATADEAAKSALYKIHAAYNGLKAGDHIRLTGLTGQAIFGGVAPVPTPNGIYTVVSADDGGFVLAAGRYIDCGGVGTSVTEAVAAGAKWQKVTGTSSATFTAAAAATATVANNSDDMTLDVGAFNALHHVLNGLAAGEVVFISGLGLVGGVSVPDGYYRVTAVDPAAPGTFRINILAAIGPAAGIVGVAIGHNFNITRVGVSAQDHTIDGSRTFTPAALPNRVRVTMRNHGFSVDDYVAFGGIASLDERSFKIVSADSHGFEIELADAAEANALVGLAVMPVGAYVDFRGKFDQAVGLMQDKDGVSLDAIYDANGGPGRNLATAKFAGIWEQSINLYDELGVVHSLKIAFAKIGTNQWATQLFVPKDPVTGKYPIDGLQQDGIIASGVINFNGSGAIQSIDGNIKDAIGLKWTSGASETTFKLNFGQIADATTTTIFNQAGVKHVSGENAAFSIDQDGYAPGKFVSLKVNPDTGELIASYDNGHTQAVYQIPLCYFPAPNALTAVGGATYKASFESGGAILKKSGEDGVGHFVSNALEQSNIDTTDEMANLIASGQLFSLISSAFAKMSELEESFIRKM